MTQPCLPDEDTTLEQLEAIPKASDKVRLAGLVLHAKVNNARTVALVREQAWAEARFGAKDQRTLQVTGRLEREREHANVIRALTDQATLSAPERDKTATIVYGRVTENRIGQPELTVAALNKNKELLAFDCSDTYGAYRLTIKGKQPFRLQVTNDDNMVLYTADEMTDAKPGTILFREIRLDGVEPRKPKKEPDDRKRTKTKVPDLLKRPEAEALRLLRATDLEVGKRTEEITDGDAGLVIAQKPEAGTEADIGSKVDITVSQKDVVEVPNVLGETLEAARKIIEEAGLVTGEPKTRRDPEHVGEVVDQSPKAGTKVAKESEVVLTIGEDVDR